MSKHVIRGGDNLLDHITIIYATIKAIGSEYIIAGNDQYPLCHIFAVIFGYFTQKISYSQTK